MAKYLICSKTNLNVREDIIKLLDEENAWEHVVMNYLAYVPKKSSPVAHSNGVIGFHAALNSILDGRMKSYHQIREESEHG